MCRYCTFGPSETVVEEIEEEVDEHEGMEQCPNCAAWVEEDDLTAVTYYKYTPAHSIGQVEERFCDQCTGCCYRCDTYFRTEDLITLDEEWYCNDCTETCPGCETTIVWGRGYCSDECRPDMDCDCESPAMSFAIRNDGEDPLHNDVRVTVGLAAGVISTEGIEEIKAYLHLRASQMTWLTLEEREEITRRRQQLREVAYQVRYMDPWWQTKEGNFTKRLSKLAYKQGLKLDPEIISNVGNMARAHSSEVTHDIEVTRDLNLSPDQFANEGSCWWQSESQSRCTLKSNGGFGLRAFGSSETLANGMTYEPVVGRAWVIPLRKNDVGRLVATFETYAPDGFIVFNGYGTLQGYAAPRVLAHMAGMTYRKVDFSGDDMYVNGSSGYLVAPEDIAAPYTDGSLYLYTTTHSNLFEDESNTTKEYADA